MRRISEVDLMLATGKRLGHYEILAPIGAGGMGEVYRARDSRLDREVAVKVLPESLASDRGALARFQSEARAIAALSHPNILAVFDLGESGGTSYTVTELLEGQTLRDRLDAGPLPRTRAIEIALQIARGLGAAHEKGIVHRDLKPENVFLTRDDGVKILDFGLARRTGPAGGAEDLTSALTQEQHTTPGTILGTVGYMSPEQLRGQPVDHRSDIFSFGAVLYEMLADRKAFRRDSPAETMAAVLTQDPPELSRSGIQSSAAAEVVRHCLEKDAGRRFQSARDLIFNLQQILGAPAGEDSDLSARTGLSIAILPFRNVSADPENEFFADGITDDVIANLAKIRSLKVISRTSVMAFKRTERSLREIGQTLGARTILEGSVRRAGNRARIVAHLVDARTDEQLWAETYDRELTDIFTIQTDVALQIVAALQAELSADEKTRLQKKPTHDLHAYQLYLQGRFVFYKSTEEGYRLAREYFEQAIAKDPGFALAWIGLANVHTEYAIGQGAGAMEPAAAFAKAKEYVAKALELDNDLGDAHGVRASLMFLCDYDWAGAEREFELALRLSPGSADTYDRYGWLCSALERYDDSIRLIKRARELDPLPHQSDLGTEYLRAGRYPEALEIAAEVISLDPDRARGHTLLGWANVLMGNYEKGIPALERGAALSPGSMFQAQLAEAYAMAGRMDEARAILRELLDLAARRYVSPYHLAYVYTGLGQQEEAIDCLEKAFEERSGAMYGVKGSFLFRPLRSHPRFQALMRRMNLA
ncbi:MAG TPA: protein kinase [Thermoanaerobaculia bacterium]|nr:protein kinase [Thermoanaerobaculia bacterium]